MAEQVVQQEEQMTYIDFKKVRVNPNITLSIVESGKTVESIKRREKVVHIITTVLTYLFIVALALTVMFPFYWMIITSLKQNDEIMATQQTLFLKHLTSLVICSIQLSLPSSQPLAHY